MCAHVQRQHDGLFIQDENGLYRSVRQEGREIQQVTDWISVKDKEPHEGTYLAYTMCGFVGIFMFSGHDWYDKDSVICAKGYVTHWMPLPTPPGGKM